MNILPFNLKSLLFLSTLVVFLAIFPNSALAASAYVSPATGLITNQNFKVSFYVESSATEPEIAGAELVITYPSNISVVSINEGEFDSYVEKSNNSDERKITINAINNAGSYKSGKVKVASVNFEALQNSGDVQLTITSSSGISGAGGEQLLTETINGVYTLDIAEEITTTGEDNSTAEESQMEDSAETVGGGVGSPSAGETEESPAVPETGGNDIIVSALISAGLIGVGLLAFALPLNKNELN